MDPSTAAAWRDLYIGTVGAGASLTGLTFVAIALDPHQIERTPLLRLRAASALWCFVSVMFIGLAVQRRPILRTSTYSGWSQLAPDLNAMPHGAVRARASTGENKLTLSNRAMIALRKR